MRLLFAALLLIATFAGAQETPVKGPNYDSDVDATKPQVYQGCAIRSNGNVLLAVASGTEYNLVSNARKLDAYVGQEVRVTATQINPHDPSLDMHGASNPNPPGKPATLDVEDIAKVSDHCSSPK
jgi:Protein of unknown function (DUF5818)